MEIPLQKGLGISHEAEFKLCHFQMKGLVIIKLPFHEILVGPINIIPFIQVIVGLHENQFFRNIAEVR